MSKDTKESLIEEVKEISDNHLGIHGIAHHTDNSKRIGLYLTATDKGMVEREMKELVKKAHTAGRKEALDSRDERLREAIKLLKEAIEGFEENNEILNDIKNHLTE